jgi:hypothetical protein
MLIKTGGTPHSLSLSDFLLYQPCYTMGKSFFLIGQKITNNARPSSVKMKAYNVIIGNKMGYTWTGLT